MVPGPTALVLSETCAPLNVAVTVVLAFSWTIHSVVAVVGRQGLENVQLTNVAPGLGEALRTTSEPGAKEVPGGF